MMKKSFHPAQARTGGLGRLAQQPSVDVLTPLIPPTYPPAPKPSPLCQEAMEKVTVYKRFCQYLASNYGIPYTAKVGNAFNVDRYTDKYNSLLTANPDIVPRLGADRLPEELLTLPKQFKRTKRPKLPLRKGAIEDLPEEDVPTKEDADGEPVTKKSRETEDAPAAQDNLEEEEVEDADDELDMGTDYAANYFDNGEDFLDSDRDGDDDDGPVY